jgi:hypothetical protein
MLIYIMSDHGLFSLDATESFSVNYANEVTEYPVESGFSITKGIIKKNNTFTITGIISDYHLKESYNFRSDKVLNDLKTIKETRNFVSLSIKDNIFANLIIASIEAEESSSGGIAKRVTISFTEVRVASSRTTSVPRDARLLLADLASPKTNGGISNKKTIEKDVESKTWYQGVKGWVGTIFGKSE